MADNLVLYSGTDLDNMGQYHVSMNETDNQLRFDLLINGDRFQIIFRDNGSSLQYVSNIPTEDFFGFLTQAIYDSSAHKVYRKAIFKFLRRYTSSLSSFDMLAAPSETVKVAAYPIFNYISRNNDLSLEKILTYDRGLATRALRQSTPQRAVKVLFGAKRYRKDLVKAFAETANLELLTFALSLKREVPVDWFISILRNNPTVQHIPEEFDYAVLKEFYEVISDKQFRRLCKCFMQEDMINVSTLLDMAETHKNLLESRTEAEDHPDNIKFRSVEEFHLMISKYLEVTEKEQERQMKLKKHGGPIQGNKQYDALAAISTEAVEYDIVLPKYGYDLVEWGKTMQNCIGSYAQGAAKSDSDAYFALKEKGTDKMIANILVRKGKVAQFFGKRNSQVSESLARKFSMQLLECGVVEKPSDLFGKHGDLVRNEWTKMKMDGTVKGLEALGDALDRTSVAVNDTNNAFNNAFNREGA